MIPSLLASCSRKECIRFSLFLRLLFAQVDYWNRDEALFQDQFANFGCALKSSGGDDDNQEKLSFQELGSIVEEFQKSIFTHLCNLLQGGNYMSIRNALLVISEVEEVFPKTPSHAKELADCVDDLRSSFAKGSDVYTSASRTQAQLLRVQFSLEGYSQPSTDALNPVLPSSDASSDIKEDQREEILQVSSVPSPSDAPTQTTRTIHETWQTDPETELEEGEATFSEPTNSKEDEKQADQKSVTQKRPRPELAKEDSVASRVGDKRMKISDANYRNSRERSGRFFQRRDDAFRLQDSSSRSQGLIFSCFLMDFSKCYQGSTWSHDNSRWTRSQEKSRTSFKTTINTFLILTLRRKTQNDAEISLACTFLDTAFSCIFKCASYFKPL